jgi:hypothetical protein
MSAFKDMLDRYELWEEQFTTTSASAIASKREWLTISVENDDLALAGEK